MAKFANYLSVLIIPLPRRVVNKLSRFHRSAGLNENQPSTSSGRNSPNPTLGSSPGAGRSLDPPCLSLGGLPLPYPSPHLPPYPVPTVIQPIAQLRQPYIQTLTSQGNYEKGSFAFTHSQRICSFFDKHKKIVQYWQEKLYP